MADPVALPRVRGNVEKMINAGAPPHDIDDYLASEGYSKDTFKAAVKPPAAVGQGGAPTFPYDSTKTPDKWSPEAVVRDNFALGHSIPGVDRLRTQAVKGVADAMDFADTFNPITGPIRYIASKVAPETVNALSSGNIVRNAVFNNVVPETDATTPAGKVVDAGVRAAAGSVALPGSFVRNLAPAVVGGALSEFAGQQAAGSPYEVPIRVAAGLVGGVGTAGLQAGGGAAFRGARNVLAPNTEDTATRIAGRALERDKLTPQQMLTRMKDLGDDAMPVDAGGENVRGALRGSVAAPGQARTTVVNAFTDRADKEGARVGASIDKNVSPKTLTATVDELIAERNTTPKPLYDKALDVGQVWSPRIQQFLNDPLIQPGIKRGLEIQRLEALAQNKPFDPKAYGVTGFNAAGDPIISGTPNMRLLDAAKKGVDAIINDYRNPVTGRVVLDERGRAIEGVRKAFLSELDAANPDYAAARAAYATPSQMKDAAELGARLFSTNARPEVVAREFKKLSPDAQDAFRVGVAETLRKTAGARDATNVAGRVMGGPDAQARLRAVLGPEEADRIMADLAREKTFTQSARAVGQGSRTTPMALEAADNAGAAAGVVGDVARGRFVNALSRVAGRITEGRTEAVNAKVAEFLTSVKPEDQTAFLNALEQTMARQRLRSPGNAFRSGAVAPITAGAANDRR